MFLKFYSFSLPTTTALNPSGIPNPFDSITKDVGILLLVNVFFLLATFLVSLFFTITTVILSSASCNNKILSGREMVLKVVKSSWIRPFITSFYTTLIGVGYIFIVITLSAPLLMFSGTFFVPISVILAVAAYAFYLFLNVDLILALVVSVMEEKNYGILALGKAGMLIKEKRLQGFILNVFLALMNLVLSFMFKTVLGKKGMANQRVFLVFVSIFSCLVRIMLLVIYTVVYFRCKKDNGEEIELQDSVGYEKLSVEPKLSDAGVV